MADLLSILRKATFDPGQLAARERHTDGDPDELYVWQAKAVLAALADPANRDALVAWLVEAKIASEANLWDIPDDPGEVFARIAEQIDGDYTDAELDALLDEEGLLREALRRTTPYSEGEPRPASAVTLWRIEREGGS